MNQPAPVPRRPTASSTAVAILSLVSTMAFSTPSVRAATVTEVTPEAAACPAANRPAALIVETTTEVGADAVAAFCASAAASVFSQS